MNADVDLVRRCIDGEASAWSELILRYRRLIYSIPFGFRLPAGDADEIFQLVSMKLLEHLPQLRRAETLASWIAVTTRRECLALLRAQRRTQPLAEGAEDEIEAESPDIAANLHEIECQHALALAFERLDATCRELLGALFLEDPRPSYEELSARIDRPVGSLGPTRSRCLEKLRELYLDSGGEPP